jgi:putative spermidine/putrescine transport system ATP-binding protein
MTNLATTDTGATYVARQGATVQLIGVTKSYGGPSLALTGVDLTMKPGEFIALLGPSGCGKTTVLRTLSGLEQVTEGRILIDGDDIVSVPVNKRDMGMVFQAYSLFPHMTVLENVEFGLRMRKVDAAARARRSAEALEMVSLGHLGERYAHQLSGGQQQRVALARALVTRPRVLLLDEPLSALDAKVRVQLRDEIRRIQTELGITTLFVTHDQEEALAVADRVAVMNSGNIEQIGTPEELYTSPATPFVANFVGLSNRVPATVAGHEVTVYGAKLQLLGVAPADGPVFAMIRPEDFTIKAGTLAAKGLAGVVVTSSFLGSFRRTQVRLDDETLVAVQHDVSERHEPGDDVSLALKGSPVSVLAKS